MLKVCVLNPSAVKSVTVKAGGSSVHLNFGAKGLQVKVYSGTAKDHVMIHPCREIHENSTYRAGSSVRDPT